MLASIILVVVAAATSSIAAPSTPKASSNFAIKIQSSNPKLNNLYLNCGEGQSSSSSAGINLQTSPAKGFFTKGGVKNQKFTLACTSAGLVNYPVVDGFVAGATYATPLNFKPVLTPSGTDVLDPAMTSPDPKDPTFSFDSENKLVYNGPYGMDVNGGWLYGSSLWLGCYTANYNDSGVITGYVAEVNLGTSLSEVPYKRSNPCDEITLIKA